MNSVTPLEVLYDVEHIYKEYVYRLRKAEIYEPYIILGDYSASQLKRYVRYIYNLNLNKDKYTEYYSSIRHVINSFMYYYSELIDKVSDICEIYCNKLDKADLLELFDSTIEMHIENQKEFVKEYLPINSTSEQRKYDEIVARDAEFMAMLLQMKGDVQTIYRKQCDVDVFVKEHFTKTVMRTHRPFIETRLFISMLLKERMAEIRSCLTDILHRIDKNLQDYVDHINNNLAKYHNELYDLNKEKLILTRHEQVESDAYAAVIKSIEKIRRKIHTAGNQYSMQRLEEERQYWIKRIKDLDEIRNIIEDLEKELRRSDDEEKKLAEIKLSKAEKTVCSSVLNFNYKEHKNLIKAKIIETAWCLTTFFCVKGSNRIIYRDHAGSYFVDEYNHRNYPQDYKRTTFHMDCDGKLVEYPDTIPYYFDGHGRYIIRDGKKIYQIAHCTSEYELSSNNLLKKVTKDCGHGDKWLPECQLGYTDQTNIEVLPSTRPVNIKGALTADDVRYLWDSFGWILPEVLNKVWCERPKNPIHMVAHELVRCKYNTNKSEILKKQREATEYRAKIYNEYKQRKQEEYRKWKSNSVPHRRPADSNESMQRIGLANYTALLHHMTNVNNLQ